MAVVGKAKYYAKKYLGSLGEAYGVYDPTKAVPTKEAAPAGYEYVGTTEGDVVLMPSGGVQPYGYRETAAEREVRQRRDIRQRAEEQRKLEEERARRMALDEARRKSEAAQLQKERQTARSRQIEAEARATTFTLTREYRAGDISKEEYEQYRTKLAESRLGYEAERAKAGIISAYFIPRRGEVRDKVWYAKEPAKITEKIAPEVLRLIKAPQDLTAAQLKNLERQNLIKIKEGQWEFTAETKQKIADAAKEGKIIRYTPEGVIIEERPTKFQAAEEAVSRFLKEKTVIKELTPPRVERFAEISARTAAFVPPIGVAGIAVLPKKLREEFIEMEKAAGIARAEYITERPITTAALVGVGIAVPPLIKGITAAAQLGLGVKAGTMVAKGVTVGAGIGMTGVYTVEKGIQLSQAKTSREVGKIIGETEIELGAITLGAGIGARAVRGVEAGAAVRRAKKFRLKLVEKPKKFIPERISDKQLMKSLMRFRRGKIPAHLKFPTEKAFLREASKIITRRAARARGIDLKQLSKMDKEFMRGQIAARLRARPEIFLPEIHKIAIKKVRAEALLRRVPEVRRIALKRFVKKPPTKLPITKVKKPFRIIKAKDIFKEISIDKGVKAIGRRQVQLLKLKPLVKVEPAKQIISFKQLQRFKLLKKQIPMFGITQAQRQKFRITTKQVPKFKLRERQMIALGFRLTQAERQAIGLVQPQRVRLIQPQMIALGLIPRQIIRERLRVPQVTIQRLILKEPIVPILAIPDLEPVKRRVPKRRKPFTVLIRRFKKWKPVAEAPTLIAARTIGERIARETLAASLKVMKKGKPILLPISPMFRRAKREPFVLVEKRKFRLDFPEEIKEIHLFPKRKKKKKQK